MDWEPIREGVRTLVSTLTGLPASWSDRERGYVSDTTDAEAYLSVVSVVSVGRDEVRHETRELDPGPGHEVVPVLQGLRIWTLSVRVEVMHHADAAHATVYTSRLRSRLRLPSSQDALAALGCALVEVLPDVEISTVYDQRARSVHALDVRISAVSVEEDTAIGWIESTELEEPDLS